MMKKLKKGFTLVELVIVIAVIAVLAAVLIPTFSGIVNRAKVTSDIETASSLNTLAANTSSVEEFVKAVEENENLSVKNLIPQVNGNKFIWAYKGTSAQVLYVDSKFNPISDKDKEYDFTGAELWTVVLNAGHIMKNPKNPINYFLGQDSTQNFTLTTLSSFKTGDNTLKGNLTITDLTATNDDAYIDGKFEGTVTINTPSAEIAQYGSIDTLNVTAVKDQSLALNGYVENLAITKGKVDIQPTGYVGELNLAATTAKVVNAGVVEVLKTADGVAVTTDTNFVNSAGTVLDAQNATFATGSEASQLQTAGFALNIANLEDLENFRDAVNGGATFKGLTVNLTQNINLEDGWTPIGNFTRALADKNKNPISQGFMGTFNGNNKTISNLNNIGYEPKVLFKNDSTISGKQEFSYGLFARVEGATITNLTLANVKIEIPTDSAVYGDSVGALVGFAKGVTINGVTVGAQNDQSKVIAYDGVGGILGRNYQGTLALTDCVNYAAISAGEKAGGVVGFVSSGKYFADFTNCENYGVVTVEAKGMANKVAYAAGIVGQVSSYSENKGNVTQQIIAKFSDCVSQGAINLSYADGVVIPAAKYKAEAITTALLDKKVTVPNDNKQYDITTISGTAQNPTINVEPLA
ncbi:MAG: type II secretion system protein [Clostridia bacterium]|nr:type II secretion system protein [Clostridia bacterium]MBR3790893.1 type II secretion system protein [Clostridia bacterium]